MWFLSYIDQTSSNCRLKSIISTNHLNQENFCKVDKVKYSSPKMSPFDVHMTQQQADECQKLCADYLAGQWKDLKEDEFNCEPIRSVSSNDLLFSQLTLEN